MRTTVMRLRLILFSVGLCVLLTTPVRADFLKLTPQGEVALRGRTLAKRSPDGRGYFVRGQIVIPRDATDRPTLKSPGTYFMFRPFQSSSEQRFEWVWVAAVTYHEVDTLDDLRGILSNRDRQYTNWDEAYKALLLEIDPTGTLGLKSVVQGGPPKVLNATIVPREGWLSRLLISGPQSSAARVALVRTLKERNPEDPLGYSPVDPLLLGEVAPEKTLAALVEAIARSEKYGEPEKGLLSASRAAAIFICDTIYPAPEAETGPDGEKARLILTFVDRARAALLGFIESANEDAVAIRVRRSRSYTADPLRYSPAEDEQPLDVYDMAKAAIKVLGDLPTQRSLDNARVVEVLIGLASNESTATAKQALTTLIDLSSIFSRDGKKRPPDYRLATTYRAELLLQLSGASSSERSKPAGLALLGAGLGSLSEVALVVDGLFNAGLSIQSQNDPRLATVAYVLKNLAKAPMDEGIRGPLQSYINRRVSELEKRQDIGTGGLTERRLLDQLKGSP
jgi:hypothetical protein